LHKPLFFKDKGRKGEKREEKRRRKEEEKRGGEKHTSLFITNAALSASMIVAHCRQQ
jgi:hypothetical protein